MCGDLQSVLSIGLNGAELAWAGKAVVSPRCELACSSTYFRHMECEGWLLEGEEEGDGGGGKEKKEKCFINDFERLSWVLFHLMYHCNDDIDDERTITFASILWLIDDKRECRIIVPNALQIQFDFRWLPNRCRAIYYCDVWVFLYSQKTVKLLLKSIYDSLIWLQAFFLPLSFSLHIILSLSLFFVFLHFLTPGYHSS